MGTSEKAIHREEHGNVLFMILIAVALFAALSYAVLTTGRSGGNDASEETNLVRSAQITQYPAIVKAGLLRMMVSDGLDFTNIEFNYPEDFDDCSNNGANCIFHPNGGYVAYQPVTPDIAANPTWLFVWSLEIDGIGTNGPGSFAGNDPAMALIYVNESLCDKIHEELGIPEVPTTTINPGFILAFMAAMETGWTGGNEGITLGTAGANDSNVLTGREQGCFKFSDGTPVYYHVLQER